MNLTDVLEAVDHRPEAIALVDGSIAVSYGEWWQTSARLAGGLREAGLVSGDRLAVWLPNGAVGMQIQLACAFAGVGVIGINLQYRSAELSTILRSTEPRVLFYTPRWRKTDYEALLAQADIRAALAGCRLVAIDGAVGGKGPSPDWRDLQAGPALAYEGKAEDPLVLFATSGTTGRPKVVVHSQDEIAWHSLNVARALAIGPGDVMLCPLPVCGVYGYNAVWSVLAGGGTAVLQAHFHAEEALELAARHQVTYMFGSDTMFRRMLDAPDAERHLASLRFGGFACFSGSPQDLVHQASMVARLPLFQVYGSSEAQALLSTWSAGDPPERRALAGGALKDSDMQVRAVDGTTRRVLPDRASGELEVRGRSVFKGYLGNVEATREVLGADGWFRTGDLGYTLEDRHFVFQSRFKDALRVRGYLTDPAEIEEILREHPDLTDAQVVSGGSPTGDDVPVAFVTARPGTSPSEADIRQFCLGRMARYKVPERVVRVPAFPTTRSPNGEKVQRAKLREMAVRLLDSVHAEES